MDVNVGRTLGDFSYMDRYTCVDNPRMVGMINAQRKEYNYTEHTMEYLDPVHHWRGMELWEWIVKAYQAGKNGEELTFTISNIEESQNVDKYYKLNNSGKLLDENNNVIGYQQYRPTYWGEKFVVEEPIVNGKTKYQILDTLWANYLKENNIVLPEESKKVEISIDELIEGIHYSKYKKDYNKIEIDWDNCKEYND